MATQGMVLVSSLVEPLFEDRQESLYENIDELRERIRTEGLHQPIGVVALPDGKHRIIWGHRRSIAVTQLGWEFIDAKIHQEGEIDERRAKVTENLHRNNLSIAEEARMWDYLLPSDPEGTIGLARTYNVPQSRIEGLLGLLRGDPDVWKAVAERGLNKSQAIAINRFPSKGYRLHALELAEREGWSAERIERWHTEKRAQGIDLTFEVVPHNIMEIDNSAPKVPMDVCMLGNHEVTLNDRKIWVICTEHWNLVIKGLEYNGQMTVLEEAGYLPEFKKLLRKAEAELNGSNNTGRDISTSGS